MTSTFLETFKGSSYFLNVFHQSFSILLASYVYIDCLNPYEVLKEYLHFTGEETGA